MSTEVVILELTLPQAKDLQLILDSAQDEGPEGEGWASVELTELRRMVDSAISDAIRR